MLTAIKRRVPVRWKEWIKARVGGEALSYLGRDALGQLYEVATELEARKVPGVFVEAGCALGGSAVVIATAIRRAGHFMSTTASA
jgi:cephalosporin hydroxylase